MLIYFEELGRYKVDGMSELPLSFQDFYYWMQCTNRKLSSWEINTLIRMSEYFLSYKNNPESIKPPYYSDEIKEELIEIQRSYNEIVKNKSLNET